MTVFFGLFFVLELDNVFLDLGLLDFVLGGIMERLFGENKWFIIFFFKEIFVIFLIYVF